MRPAMSRLQAADDNVTAILARMLAMSVQAAGNVVAKGCVTAAGNDTAITVLAMSRQRAMTAILSIVPVGSLELFVDFSRAYFFVVFDFVFIFLFLRTKSPGIAVAY